MKTHKEQRIYDSGLSYIFHFQKYDSDILRPHVYYCKLNEDVWSRAGNFRVLKDM